MRCRISPCHLSELPPFPSGFDAIFVYNLRKSTNSSVMKKTNIIYWTSTVLFGGFMLFSAIPDIMVVPDAVAFLSGKLGYPQYIIAFLGVAKTLGVIALFVPGFPRITEWAYAGLTYDLIGATYSNIAVDGFQPGIMFMFVILGVEAVSYLYFHKRLRLKTESKVPETVLS